MFNKKYFLQYSYKIIFYNNLRSLTTGIKIPSYKDYKRL